MSTPEAPGEAIKAAEPSSSQTATDLPDTSTDTRNLRVQGRPFSWHSSETAANQVVPLTPFKSRPQRPWTECPPSAVTASPSTRGSPTRLSERPSRGRPGAGLSVSTLYREMAGSVAHLGSHLGARCQSERPPGRPTASVARGGWVSPCKVKMNTGRMFLRDKGTLTKGEREIIQGICENRGDLRKNKSEYVVRSHQDAWWVGKPAHVTLRVGRESPPDLRIVAGLDPANGESSADGAQVHGAERTTCALCLMEEELFLRSLGKHSQRPIGGGGSVVPLVRTQENFPKSYTASSGISAPPPTPIDATEATTLSDDIWCLDEEMHSDDDMDDIEDLRPKLHVQVYLPHVSPEPAEDDPRAERLLGQPVLARQRPLSYNDLGREREKQGAEQMKETGERAVIKERLSHKSFNMKPRKGSDNSSTYSRPWVW